MNNHPRKGSSQAAGCILLFTQYMCPGSLSPRPLPTSPLKSLAAPFLMCQRCSKDTERSRQDKKRQLVPCELAFFYVLYSPIPEWSINHPLPVSLALFPLSPQLGCVTTRCCAVRTAVLATTISVAIVPPASRASCARELAARAPGSAVTNCQDGPPSITPLSAASSLLPL